MKFEIERFNFYNREDVENLIKCIQSYVNEIKKNQPLFNDLTPLHKHYVAAALGECMRLNRWQDYRNEQWKISQNGKFIAWALSREIYIARIDKIFYPILMFAPINWDKTAKEALKCFILKFINQGYKLMWIRMPYKSRFMDGIQIEGLKITFEEMYPREDTVELVLKSKLLLGKAENAPKLVLKYFENKEQILEKLKSINPQNLLPMWDIYRLEVLS